MESLAEFQQRESLPHKQTAHSLCRLRVLEPISAPTGNLRLGNFCARDAKILGKQNDFSSIIPLV
jgi:hypothetical protein